MRVAVVGGGLCGLATTVHLVERGHQVIVFDGKMRDGVAQQQQHHQQQQPEEARERTERYLFETASAVAAGLLHPLSPRLKLTWEADAAMRASVELLERALKRDPKVVSSETVYRPFRDEADAELGRAAEARLGRGRVLVLEPAELLKAVAPFEAETRFGGARLVEGRVVDVPRYLRVLWDAAHAQGAEWRAEDADPALLLESYDRVAFCGGARGLSEIAPPGSRLTRGQSLVLSGPPSTAALLRGDYLAPVGGGSYVLGATREAAASYSEACVLPDPAPLLLADKLAAAARLAGFDRPASPVCTPVNSTAGVRLDGPKTHLGRLPFVGVPRPGLVVAGGLGARGLLRHGQLGQLVADLLDLDLDADYEAHVPSPLWASSLDLFSASSSSS